MCAHYFSVRSAVHYCLYFIYRRWSNAQLCNLMAKRNGALCDSLCDAVQYSQSHLLMAPFESVTKPLACQYRHTRVSSSCCVSPHRVPCRPDGVSCYTQVCTGCFFACILCELFACLVSSPAVASFKTQLTNVASYGDDIRSCQSGGVCIFYC